MELLDQAPRLEIVKLIISLCLRASERTDCLNVFSSTPRALGKNSRVLTLERLHSQSHGGHVASDGDHGAAQLDALLRVLRTSGHDTPRFGVTAAGVGDLADRVPYARVRRLAEQAGVALARIWLLDAGDITANNERVAADVRALLPRVRWRTFPYSARRRPRY